MALRLMVRGFLKKLEKHYIEHIKATQPPRSLCFSVPLCLCGKKQNADLCKCLNQSNYRSEIGHGYGEGLPIRRLS